MRRLMRFPIDVAILALGAAALALAAVLWALKWARSYLEDPD